eukprot:gb/GECH01009264.1/.p1 GENE.gb/GECH01009264.1/~~gb/GECH01009264.1/.p1  ORF type:complete len:1160 (+),score=271.53 gb/GECH01009264.1/:1-3480(+)
MINNPDELCVLLKTFLALPERERSIEIDNLLLENEDNIINVANFSVFLIQNSQPSIQDNTLFYHLAANVIIKSLFRYVNPQENMELFDSLQDTLLQWISNTHIASYSQVLGTSKLCELIVVLFQTEVDPDLVDNRHPLSTEQQQRQASFISFFEDAADSTCSPYRRSLALNVLGYFQFCLFYMSYKNITSFDTFFHQTFVPCFRDEREDIKTDAINNMLDSLNSSSTFMNLVNMFNSTAILRLFEEINDVSFEDPTSFRRIESLGMGILDHIKNSSVCLFELHDRVAQQNISRFLNICHEITEKKSFTSSKVLDEYGEFFVPFLENIHYLFPIEQKESITQQSLERAISLSHRVNKLLQVNDHIQNSSVLQNEISSMWSLFHSIRGRVNPDLDINERVTRMFNSEDYSERCSALILASAWMAYSDSEHRFAMIQDLNQQMQEENDKNLRNKRRFVSGSNSVNEIGLAFDAIKDESSGVRKLAFNILWNILTTFMDSEVKLIAPVVHKYIMDVIFNQSDEMNTEQLFETYIGIIQRVFTDDEEDEFDVKQNNIQVRRVILENIHQILEYARKILRDALFDIHLANVEGFEDPDSSRCEFTADLMYSIASVISLQSSNIKKDIEETLPILLEFCMPNSSEFSLRSNLRFDVMITLQICTVGLINVIRTNYPESCRSLSFNPTREVIHLLQAYLQGLRTIPGKCVQHGLCAIAKAPIEDKENLGSVITDVAAGILTKSHAQNFLDYMRMDGSATINTSEFRVYILAIDVLERVAKSSKELYLSLRFSICQKLFQFANEFPIPDIISVALCSIASIISYGHEWEDEEDLMNLLKDLTDMISACAVEEFIMPDEMEIFPLSAIAELCRSKVLTLERLEDSPIDIRGIIESVCHCNALYQDQRFTSSSPLLSCWDVLVALSIVMKERMADYMSTGIIEVVLESLDLNPKRVDCAMSCLGTLGQIFENIRDGTNKYAFLVCPKIFQVLESNDAFEDRSLARNAGYCFNMLLEYCPKVRNTYGLQILNMLLKLSKFYQDKTSSLATRDNLASALSRCLWYYVELNDGTENHKSVSNDSSLLSSLVQSILSLVPIATDLYEINTVCQSLSWIVMNPDAIPSLSDIVNQHRQEILNVLQISYQDAQNSDKYMTKETKGRVSDCIQILSK